MQPPSEPTRRNWIIACGAVGAGAAAAVAVPLLGSMAPSEKARSAGAPVEVDIADIPAGGVKIVEWRGKPVWVVRRTPEMVQGLGPSMASWQTPTPIAPITLSRPMQKMFIGPSSPNSLLPWAFARTSAARRSASLKRASPRALRLTGQVGFSVLAMAQHLILQGVSLRINPHPITLKSQGICTSQTVVSL
jgi:hypothetical protein